MASQNTILVVLPHTVQLFVLRVSKGAGAHLGLAYRLLGLGGARYWAAQAAVGTEREEVERGEGGGGEVGADKLNLRRCSERTSAAAQYG
jgi:hypothetical protein